MTKKYNVVVKQKNDTTESIVDSFVYTTNNRENIKSFCDKVYTHKVANYIEIFNADTNVIMGHKYNNKWTS